MVLPPPLLYSKHKFRNIFSVRQLQHIVYTVQHANTHIFIDIYMMSFSTNKTPFLFFEQEFTQHCETSLLYHRSQKQNILALDVVYTSPQLPSCVQRFVLRDSHLMERTGGDQPCTGPWRAFRCYSFLLSVSMCVPQPSAQSLMSCLRVIPRQSTTSGLQFPYFASLCIFKLLRRTIG